MSERQTIVDRIKQRLATIRVSNGYQTDIGATVKEWQTTALDESEIPATLVEDPIAKVRPDPQGQNSSKHTWATQINVKAVLQENAQNAAEGRKAVSDINKAVGVDQTWGGLARRTEPVSEALVLDKSDGHVAGVEMIFNVITSRKPWEA